MNAPYVLLILQARAATAETLGGESDFFYSMGPGHLPPLDMPPLDTEMQVRDYEFLEFNFNFLYFNTNLSTDDTEIDLPKICCVSLECCLYKSIN